jgi:hypothetical protein
MSAAPVLRRSTRNAAKRESPAVTTTEETVPAAKKKRTNEKKPAAPKKAAAAAAKSGDETTPAGGLKDGDALPDDLPEVQTHAGETTTLSALIKDSEKGIVIFAYPKGMSAHKRVGYM